MEAQGITSGFAFSRNPIILRQTWPQGSFDKNGGRFELMVDGSTIYDGRFFPPLDIDVSEIFDAYIQPLPEPPADNTGPLCMIENNVRISRRKALCHFEYAGHISEYEFTIIPGGISKQNFRRLQALGQDIFNTRFFNPECNFFLTTRTAGWRVVVKETELFPLYFFINRQNEQMVITEKTTGQSLTFEDLDQGILTLDIDALRRNFFDEYQVISNIFDIFLAGVFSCRIVVGRSDISKERYRLKFRNSLGVYEIIELTGELSISPAYDDGEESTFKRYDSAIGDFYSDRERISRGLSVEIETGVKRPDEIRFLMDMIGSGEVYLLDFSELPVKVIPSAEQLNCRARPETPQTFTVKLQMSEDEANIMQDIIDGLEGRRPRVFSKQFSKLFN